MPSRDKKASRAMIIKRHKRFKRLKNCVDLARERDVEESRTHAAKQKAAIVDGEEYHFPKPISGKWSKG